MLEQKLAHEFKSVAEAAPVPHDLFPTRKLAGGRRMPRWATIAAAAAVVLGVGFTPAGQRMVDATTQWVTSYKVVVGPETLPVKQGRAINFADLKTGEIIEYSGDGMPKQVVLVTTAADLPQGEPAWPLPTYLPPEPGARALVTDVYDDANANVQATEVQLIWNPTLNGEQKSLSLSVMRIKTGVSPAMLDRIRKGNTPAMRLDGVNPSEVKQQQVTFLGHEATATYGGGRWTLLWYHAGGSGHLSGNIPLDELLKVAESLPGLK